MLARMAQRARRRGEERTTTVTLQADLMQRAKILAIKRRTSFKALIEEGLRLVLAHDKGGST
jgi:hypothetical protein